MSANDHDFLVLGSLTRFGTMTSAIRLFLARVKSREWMNKPFAAFDTENPENIEQARIQNKQWSAAEKIAVKLRDKRMNQLLPWIGLLFNMWLGTLIGVVLYIASRLFSRQEEETLSNTFGTAWDEYCKKVEIPWL